MKSILFLVYFSCAAVLCPAAAKESQWRRDCVGVLQFDLPGDATIAGISLGDLREEILTPSQAIHSKFPDGQRASWVRVLYKGELAISNPLSTSQKNSLSQAFDDAKDLTMRRLQQGGVTGTSVLKDITGFPAGAKGWIANSSVTLLVDLSDHVLFTRISERAGAVASIESAKALAKNISYRRIFDVPSSPGVCLPYAFVRDGRPINRNIGVLYKLVDHPDVTIYIRDANAAKFHDGVREKNASPKRRNEDFWAQYGVNDSVARIVSISETKATFPSLRGWRTAFASIAKIERHSGATDFGYFASLRGDPDSQNSLDLDLTIIRDTDVAKSGRHAPISLDEFMDLVKRLPETINFRD